MQRRDLHNIIMTVIGNGDFEYSPMGKDSEHSKQRLKDMIKELGVLVMELTDDLSVIKKRYKENDDLEISNLADYYLGKIEEYCNK